MVLVSEEMFITKESMELEIISDAPFIRVVMTGSPLAIASKQTLLDGSYKGGNKNISLAA